MAGSLVQLDVADVGGVDLLVAALGEFLADEGLELVAEDGAPGHPEDQAGADDLGDGEQAELLAEDAVVALLRFLDRGDVFFEFLLVEEGGAVHAGELLAVGVAAPVGAGDGLELEGLDLAGAGHVGAAAQVGEIALAVDGDGLLAGAGELVDDLVFEALLFAVQDCLGLGGLDVLAAELQVLLDDFAHLLLDLGQVVGGEGDAFGELEVVEEAVLDHRADGVLDLGAVEVAEGLGEDVGGGVAHDEQAVGVAVGDDRDLVGAVELVGHVHELAVHAGDDGGLGQAFADGLGELRDGGAVGDFAGGVVGEFDGGHGCG